MTDWRARAAGLRAEGSKPECCRVRRKPAPHVKEYGRRPPAAVARPHILRERPDLLRLPLTGVGIHLAFVENA